MKTDREKAQARVTKWKKKLMRNHEIARMLGIHEADVSRVYTGNGNVSGKSVDKIINAQEPV